MNPVARRPRWAREMTVAMWLCSAMTIVSAVVSLGYSVVGLRGATPGSRLASEYALARSSALGVIAVIAPFTGTTGFIAAAGGAGASAR